MNDMKKAWTDLPTWVQVVIGVFALLVVVTVAASGSNSSKKHTDTNQSAQTTASTSSTTTEAKTKTTPAKPKPDRDVDKRTRAFMDAMGSCQIAVALIRDELKHASSLDPVSLADDTTQARDVCDQARSATVTIDDKHFSDQATTGFYAMDRYKSGLNALLAYIDNPRPTKVIEARDKLQEGDQAVTQAMHDINKRRHVYALKSYRG